MSRNLIVKAAFFGEGSLLIIALFWYYYSSSTLKIEFTAPLVFLGILATLPVFIINFALYWLSQKLPEQFQQINRFSRDIVKPLCEQLGPVSALLIALLSGFCEEIFFRGFLLDLAAGYMHLALAVTISSMIFAYAHLIGFFRTYWQIFIVYFLIALYFSWLVLSSESLVPAIVSHALYNFLTILYLSRRK